MNLRMVCVRRGQVAMVGLWPGMYICLMLAASPVMGAIATSASGEQKRSKGSLLLQSRKRWWPESEILGGSDGSDGLSDFNLELGDDLPVPAWASASVATRVASTAQSQPADMRDMSAAFVSSKLRQSGVPTSNTSDLQASGEAAVANRSGTSRPSTNETTKASGHQNMETQCLSFAKWVKEQHLKGKELVKVWRSTCIPALVGGSPDARFATMCDALGGAASSIAEHEDWSPEVACQSVLRTFLESGVGASPFEG
mmetsp:Transcript_37686/g.82766  ORF Transcript_37686/g.82766 Transcript_37686/m.82766 type:complete len:256 (+) Transcript_37686:30-797(+)